jgi:hypothetical protein
VGLVKKIIIQLLHYLSVELLFGEGRLLLVFLGFVGSVLQVGVDVSDVVLIVETYSAEGSRVY